jgi:hypothetical protein
MAGSPLVATGQVLLPAPSGQELDQMPSGCFKDARALVQASGPHIYHLAMFQKILRLQRCSISYQVYAHSCNAESRY